MKRFGYIGGKGKLGSLLNGRDGFFCLDCDLLDISSIEREVAKVKPDIIINLAGITNIDECEKDYQKAINVNVHGTANLHDVFGKNVVTVSTDHVFNGKKNNYTEKSYPSPVNSYGMTKLGAEAISHTMGGKVIRLSRTVSIEDEDISDYLLHLYQNEPVEVPAIISRNFIHRKLAMGGWLEVYLHNYEKMPKTLHYGGNENISFYDFMKEVSQKFKLDEKLILPRVINNSSYSPRPLAGGFSIDLAKKLGMPIFSIVDTISVLAKEANL